MRAIMRAYRESNTTLMTEYANFRQRLDAILRTLDVQQVSTFLIAEKQWSVGTPANPEYAMWMMIAGSPTLRDLHLQAQQWLVSHGHEGEVLAVLGKGSNAGKSTQRNPVSRGAKGRKKPRV